MSNYTSYQYSKLLFSSSFSVSSVNIPHTHKTGFSKISKIYKQIFLTNIYYNQNIQKCVSKYEAIFNWNCKV